mmetsp:Transcript_17922/g.49712  ORF Transcript_17922/g.49712 Transcript_17922/m.49712 type:complete len:191 (+) Transcript_17922:1286-1858(+)
MSSTVRGTANVSVADPNVCKLGCEGCARELRGTSLEVSRDRQGEWGRDVRAIAQDSQRGGSCADHSCSVVSNVMRAKNGGDVAFMSDSQVLFHTVSSMSACIRKRKQFAGLPYIRTYVHTYQYDYDLRALDASRARLPFRLAPPLPPPDFFMPPAKFPLGLKDDVSFNVERSFCLNRPRLPPNPYFRFAA